MPLGDPPPTTGYPPLAVALFALPRLLGSDPALSDEAYKLQFVPERPDAQPVTGNYLPSCPLRESPDCTPGTTFRPAPIRPTR